MSSGSGHVKRWGRSSKVSPKLRRHFETGNEAGHCIQFTQSFIQGDALTGDWTEGNPCRGIVIRQKSTSVLEPGDAQKDVVVRSEGSHTPQRAGAHLIDS